MAEWHDYQYRQREARAAAEKKRAEETRKAELLRQAGGSRRREVELLTLGRAIPAGPWDADCEAWPEKSYEWDLGAGFKAVVNRVPRDWLLGNAEKGWTWASGIIRPAWYPIGWNWHPSIYESAGASGDLPPGPIKDLCHDWNTGYLGTQRTSPTRHAQPQTGVIGPRQRYTTFERARDEVYLLVGHLVSLLFTHKEEILDADKDCPFSTPEKRAGFAVAFEEHQEDLLCIREMEMRAWLRRKDEFTAEAEQERVWAAEDVAAAEARAEAARALKKRKEEAYQRVRVAARLFYEWAARTEWAQTRLDYIKAGQSRPEREGERDMLEKQVTEKRIYTAEEKEAILADMQLCADHPIFRTPYIKPAWQVRNLKKFLSA
jgi:hypothetical protein